MYLLLIILGFCVALVLIILASNWYFGAMMRVMVTDKHMLLESITEGGKIPEEWRAGYDRILAFLEKRKASPGLIDMLKRNAKRRYLRRLRKLRRYVKSTTLVESEPVRQMLLESLDNAATQWEAM